ncbi:hypothetical protein [Actinoplanes regularis]|uniref:hypothetical protein n=1 Tax=Actinoplanes regularis TaxID=52697 RepID=UPI0025549623|nr:hypothetical protein [Actinoplanes regularis]
MDGTVYRWSVRHKPTYAQGLAWAPLTFVVEDADAPGQVLSVATGSTRPDNWLDLPGTPVTPRMVEQSIRTALAAGWTPERNDANRRPALALYSRAGTVPRTGSVTSEEAHTA